MSNHNSFRQHAPSSRNFGSSASLISGSPPPKPPPLPPPSLLPIGKINFVAQGHPGEPAKFCVVDKDYPVRSIATRKFLRSFDLSKPEVLLSITGSAFDFTMRTTKLEQVFNRGLLKAAQSTKAWIVTGGSDSGVMKKVGEAIRGQDQLALVPCIGIASFNKVTNNKMLDPRSAEPIKYVPDKINDNGSAALNPDHTHFILVNSKDDEWGQEIKFRTSLEDYITRKIKIPLVLVAVNGGPGTVETIFEGVKRKFPIIIVDGSGRASDAIAAFVKHCRDPKKFNLDMWNQFKASAWPKMTAEYERDIFNRHLHKVRKNNSYITIFNPNESETEDMDKAILRSIFICHEASPFEHKLKLGVKWGRAEILEELFQKYDATVQGEKKSQALSAALHESLKRDKPDIYELLVTKGAGLDFVDISELYQLTTKQIKRLAIFAGLTVKGDTEEEHHPGGIRESFRKDEHPPVPRKMKKKDKANEKREEGDFSMKVFHLNESVLHFNEDSSPRANGLGDSQPIVVDPSGSSSTFFPEDELVGSLRKRSLKKLLKNDMSLSPTASPEQGKGKESDIHDTPHEQSPLLHKFPTVYSEVPFKKQSKDHLEEPGKILQAINPKYAHLLEDEEVTHTDILIWAILADRFELAKAVWRRTKFTVHSALVACHLYKVLGEWFRDEIYKQQYTWFESVAINVILELKYDDAVKILNWKWAELDCNDALSIANTAECKDFFSTTHVQHNLEDKFYSKASKNVQLSPGTKILSIILMMFLPFTIYNTGTFGPITGKVRPPRRYFYSLPVVKLYTSSLSYIFFLAILILNVLLVDPSTSNVSRFDIKWNEGVLWIWMLASFVEEVYQFSKDPKNHFSQISNRMDLVMYILLTIYFVLRMVAWYFRSQEIMIIYTDVLVISTIACFLRFMNVFAVSKSLGPLFFVIIRLFKDVGQWLFIFVLFMLSFQAGIFAFTRQAGHSGWEFFPSGTMGVGFTAILGDLGDNTLQMMTNTRFGVILILLYGLVTQVMLVNLLIAMMGNTYTVVKDNSDKEWKFYRYRLISDYDTSSSCPIPFNIIYLMYIMFKCCRARYGSLPLPVPESVPSEAVVTKLMKDASEKVIEAHECKVKYSLPQVSDSVHEHMRLITTQRDSDRLYLEQQMEASTAKNQALEAQLLALDGKLKTVAGQGPPPSGVQGDGNLDSRIEGKLKAMEDKLVRLETRLDKLESMETKMQAILDILQSQR